MTDIDSKRITLEKEDMEEEPYMKLIRYYSEEIKTLVLEKFQIESYKNELEKENQELKEELKVLKKENQKKYWFIKGKILLSLIFLAQACILIFK